MRAMLDAPTSPRCRCCRMLARAACAVSAAALAFALATGGSVAAAEPVVGNSETFWAKDWGAGNYSQIQAKARYVGDHVAVYVDESEWFSDHLVDTLGTTFDNIVYPAVVAAYGSEPNPGLDGDTRVVILVYDFDSYTVDGSFNPPDIDPDGVHYSNHREMFYLNSQALQAESQNAGALAAHEFAHLIVHYRDVMLDTSPNPAPEATWLSEGFATYAEHLAGYDGRVSGQLLAFTEDPAVSLTDFGLGLRENYGASYSFMRYVAEREGSDFIRALVEQPWDGTAGIDGTLAAAGSLDRFATLFDDWIVAGFLDGHAPQVWPYSFTGITVSACPMILTGIQPLLGTGEVPGYGAVYLDFPACSAAATFQAVVDGADGAPLQAALICWDSTGAISPLVTRFDLANAATGGTVTVAPGYDQHTLAVWARGAVGSSVSYRFTYSGAVDPPAGIQFLDMKGSDPFYGYAAALLTRGVISGKEVPKSSGLWFFAGIDNVTRAQFAKMIVLAIGRHTEAIDNSGYPTFTDVPAVYDEHGYPYDYVEEAASLEIVTGYQNGAFGPTSAITRSQLVLMITRGAAAAGKALPVYTGNTKVFADVPVSHPYYRQIMTAYTAGILNGSRGSDGRLYFRPYSSATRNHVAKMTAQLVEFLEER